MMNIFLTDFALVAMKKSSDKPLKMTMIGL